MSIFSKCCQLGSIVGSASAVPFIPTITGNNVTAPATNPTAGGGDQKEKIPEKVTPKLNPVTVSATQVPKKPKEQGPQVLQQAMKWMAEERSEGKGFTGLGCFWIPDLPGVELFFCFDKEDPAIHPYLFHYSRKGEGTALDRLRKVTSMTWTEAKFRNGPPVTISRPLQLYLQWIRKWKGTNFDPSIHCKVVEDKENHSYLLTCTSPTDSSDKPSWERKVPKGQVENANPDYNFST